MLDYAVKLTARPRAVDVRDGDALRAVGFDDTGILDICQVVSYYNYVNRLADGLGVELEDFWADEARATCQSCGTRITKPAPIKRIEFEPEIRIVREGDD